MQETEICRKCPEVYEKLKSLDTPIDWSEAFSQLEKLNWLLTPDSIELVLHNSLNLIDDSIPERFSIIKLDIVKFHINYLVFHLCLRKKTCISYIDDFIPSLDSLSFFKTHPSTPVEQLESRFILLSSLIHTCFMHFECNFLSRTKKTIPQYLSDLFYNSYISPSVSELSLSRRGVEILSRYPKPRFMYIPYFSSLASPMNNYYGEYKEGKKSGFGFESLMNGDLYKGEFSEGLMHGQGHYYWSHGGHYEGEFRSGCINGEGTEYYSSGNVYSGQFLQGKKHGKGEIKFVNGDRYLGDWKDNLMHGEGEFYWSYGVVDRGWFSKDRRHGKGEITMENGTKYSMEWDHDEVVR